jgi:hypothetical protein
MKIKKRTIRMHLENLGLFAVSGFLGFVGMTLLEYEIAKVRHPESLFLATPSALVSITSELMLLTSIVILAIIVIIYLKKLDNRQWLWWLLTFGFALFIISWFALGTTKIDLIIFG